MLYVIVENVPGYMPESDSPNVAVGVSDARERYLSALEECVSARLEELERELSELGMARSETEEQEREAWESVSELEQERSALEGLLGAEKQELETMPLEYLARHGRSCVVSVGEELGRVVSVSALELGDALEAISASEESGDGTLVAETASALELLDPHGTDVERVLGALELCYRLGAIGVSERLGSVGAELLLSDGSRVALSRA